MEWVVRLIGFQFVEIAYLLRLLIWICFVFDYLSYFLQLCSHFLSEYVCVLLLIWINSYVCALLPYWLLYMLIVCLCLICKSNMCLLQFCVISKSNISKSYYVHTSVLWASSQRPHPSGSPTRPHPSGRGETCAETAMSLFFSRFQTLIFRRSKFYWSMLQYCSRLFLVFLTDWWLKECSCHNK